MTARDRIVLTVLVTAAALVVLWMAVVSPERKQAAQLASEVSSAQSQLQSAESQVSSASAARAQYQDAYAAIVGLGKAVPAGEEVPALIYELARASGEKNVEFASITAGSGGAGSAGSGSSSSSSASSTTAAAGTFKQMPFTFVFNGTFTDLYNLFNQLDGFAQRTTAGQVAVSGRLLTVQSVKLAPSSSEPSSSGKSGSELLSGTISATAYVLPAGQTLTGGATPAGPAGATSPASSSSSAGSTAPAPAVVEAKP